MGTGHIFRRKAELRSETQTTKEHHATRERESGNSSIAGGA